MEINYDVLADYLREVYARTCEGQHTYPQFVDEVIDCVQASSYNPQRRAA